MKQTDSPDRNWRLIIGMTVGALVLLSVVMHFTVAPLIFEQQRQAAREGVKSTYSWDNAVDEYEWFIEQEHDIRATRQKLNNTRDQHKQFHETYGNDGSEWSRETRNRHSRIHDRMLALKNIHDQYVADYEARSEQAHRAIFKCGLPYDMEDKFWTDDWNPDDKWVEGAPKTAPEDPSECSSLVEAADGGPSGS